MTARFPIARLVTGSHPRASCADGGAGCDRNLRTHRRVPGQAGQSSYGRGMLEGGGYMRMSAEDLFTSDATLYSLYIGAIIFGFAATYRNFRVRTGRHIHYILISCPGFTLQVTIILLSWLIGFKNSVPSSSCYLYCYASHLASAALGSAVFSMFFLLFGWIPFFTFLWNAKHISVFQKHSWISEKPSLSGADIFFSAIILLAYLLTPWWLNAKGL
jgi:hypothetical protein